MTALSLVQDVASLLGLPQPSTIIGDSLDVTTRQIKANLKDVGKRMALYYHFPQLVREGSVTLVESQTNYSLPSDFAGVLPKTAFDSTEKWRIYEMEPDDYALEKWGIIPITPWFRWIIQGSTNTAFTISPSPDSSQAGRDLEFLYKSNRFILPPNWQTGVAYDAGAYAYSNDEVYQTTLGGTSGPTAPTGTGTVSDGGVTDWEYQSSYTDFQSDDDQFALDEHILTIGTEGFWRERKRLGTQQKQEWERLCAVASTVYGRRKHKSMVRRRFRPLGAHNVQDGSFPSS